MFWDHLLKIHNPLHDKKEPKGKWQSTPQDKALRDSLREQEIAKANDFILMQMKSNIRFIMPV